MRLSLREFSPCEDAISQTVSEKLVCFFIEGVNLRRQAIDITAPVDSQHVSGYSSRNYRRVASRDSGKAIHLRARTHSAEQTDKTRLVRQQSTGGSSRLLPYYQLGRLEENINGGCREHVGHHTWFPSCQRIAKVYLEYKRCWLFFAVSFAEVFYCNLQQTA